MKKFVSIFLVLILALTVFGCSEQQPAGTEKPQQEQQGQGTQNSETPEQEDQVEETQIGKKGFAPSLAGIKLGDSQELMLQVLGDKYQEDIFEDAPYFGESLIKMEYDNGIIVIVGADTKKVLEIETNSANTTTNLGIKVGDKAEDALTKYRAFYEEPEGMHSDGKLVGWFLLNEELDLVIFNFDQDEILVNDPAVNPDSIVKRIKLTNFKYMD